MNQYKVVKVEGSWGTEYYIQERGTGRLARNLDGSETFCTVNGQLAERVCELMNKEVAQGLCQQPTVSQ